MVGIRIRKAKERDMRKNCKTCGHDMTCEVVKHNGRYVRFNRWCEKGRKEYPFGCDDYVREVEDEVSKSIIREDNHGL
jgi:hypothetical protein